MRSVPEPVVELNVTFVVNGEEVPGHGCLPRRAAVGGVPEDGIDDFLVDIAP